jgi:hypothetical protein
MNKNKNININNLPSDFNWKTYIKLNNDLSIFANKIDAISHYLDYGIFEKRRYKISIPDDFDWIQYIILNKDLKEIKSEKDAIYHYTNFGYYENRGYIKESKNILYDLMINKKINYEDNFFVILNKIIKKNIKTSDKFIKPNEKQFYKNIKLVFPNIHYTKIESGIENENTSDLSLYSSFKIEDLKIDPHIQNEYSFIDHKFSSFANIYDSFIIIIDLPENFYGGSKFFINSIIDKYKKTQNFLILRPTNNNLINISINNKIFFNFEYDITTIKKIVEKNQSKIKKIFINHTYNFSKELIDFLFTLKKKVSVITHDHYLFNNNNITQLMYYEINDNIYKNQQYDYDFNLFENIITQNKKNLYLFKNLSELKNIVVSELPDFKASNEIITTNNKGTVIGIIGNISNIKGADFVKFLIEYFKHTKKQIIIFGNLSYSNYEHCYPYDNINELNNLLKKHKPNMLIECSLWPETYSYTLTLSMLTDLPILMLKKNISSVIDKRIKKYEKKYYFKNLNELLPLIMNNKQNYFKTIKPILYFNQFWDNYFTPKSHNYEYYIRNNENKIEEAHNKNVILITSKIYVSNRQLSYSKNRSVYTHEQRFKQTLKTISTIKQKIPDYFIVLFDNSKFTEKENIILKENVDCFINIKDNDMLNYYTNECEYKYLAELFQLISSFYYFFKFIDCTKVKNFFKISGRYFLNNEFNYNNYDNNDNIFKKNINLSDRDYYYTSFFKISNSFLTEYFMKLIDIFENKHHYFGLDLEVIYGKCFFKNMTLSNKLGVTQLISCWPEISNI